MPQAEEKKEDYIYRADPFTFVFRELDLIHGEIREIKAELGLINKSLDSMNESVNKRIDRLYLIVILNLMGIVAFLIKTFFF
ncbi:MAG: hypothetical protein ACK4TF_02645 [Thermodesulfovibrionales bacterium]